MTRLAIIAALALAIPAPALAQSKPLSPQDIASVRAIAEKHCQEGMDFPEEALEMVDMAAEFYRLNPRQHHLLLNYCALWGKAYAAGIRKAQAIGDGLRR